MKQCKNHVRVFVVGCLFGLMLFLSLYKLTESPPTWFDEGIITQTAIAIVNHGFEASLLIAPNQYVSGWYVTTGYPLTMMVAFSFWSFGISLISARVVMSLFIAAFVCAAYLLARKEMIPWLAAGSLALIVSFAPLYGNGKNVLGEVPGLFFVALFLVCVSRIESVTSSWRLFLIAGFFLGLAVSTKPIFLLLLPAVGIIILFSGRLLTARKIYGGLVGFGVTFLTWLGIQFGGSTFGQVLGHYANPNGVSTASSIVTNTLTFFTQAEPLYAALLAGIWACSFIIRVWCNRPISRSEWIAGIFTLLVYIAYLRTVGFYRYFFVGEMMALLYLPLSLDVLATKINKRILCVTLIIILTLFQGYQLFFSSWVADHYGSTRASQLKVLSSLPSDKTIFLYNTPEAAVFLPPHMQYYQYIHISEKLQVGKDEIPNLASGIPTYVLLAADASSTTDLSHYVLLRTVDRYSLWYKK